MREPRLADPGGPDDADQPAGALVAAPAANAARRAARSRVAVDERAAARPLARRAAAPAPARRGRFSPGCGATACSAAASVNTSPLARREAAADEHLAGLDAEPRGRPARVVQLERRADGAQRVVLVQLGEPEDADHDVARDVLDAAAVALDHRAEALQQRRAATSGSSSLRRRRRRGR